MNARCCFCNAVFGLHHSKQLFCSKPCRDKAQRVAEARRVERVIAERTAHLAPRRERYSEVCVMCSRTAVDHCLSDREAATYALRGLRRCPRAFCGGVLQLVALDGVR